MTRYQVRCQAADGRTHDASVRATNESGACRAALETLSRAEGWRVVWVLPW